MAATIRDSYLVFVAICSEGERQALVFGTPWILSGSIQTIYIVMRRVMIGKAFKILISAALYSLLMIVVGLLVSFLFSDSQKSLGLILFVIGAIPLVIFLPGLFGGGKSGAIHTPKVIYRLVNTLSPTNKSSRDGDESRANFNASLIWVLAGVIVWIVSYFV